MQEEYLRLNNLAIEGKPEDLALTTHVCRGNYHSTWASPGRLCPVAPFLFAQENVDAFYLEFDDERSGNFEPLKYVAEGKKVVLGLVTTKNPRLEDKQTIIARIHEAARYIPLGSPVSQPPVRLCQLRNRQQADRDAAVGQAGTGEGDCRRGVGKVTFRPEVWVPHFKCRILNMQLQSVLYKASHTNSVLI